MLKFTRDIGSMILKHLAEGLLLQPPDSSRVLDANVKINMSIYMTHRNPIVWENAEVSIRADSNH